ncbi:MAG: hypothetical protein ACFFAY_04660 [Promethearchaeota archaeon]
MKPLGTITMYFPFLDKYTVSEVETIMNQADSYYDFVLRLSERACRDKPPTLLAHLAAVHAWRLSATHAKRDLSEAFGHDPIIGIWTAPQHKMKMHELFEKINQALEAAEENWIQVELLCLKSWYARYHILDELLDYEPLQKAEAMVEERAELDCFSALVHTVRSELSFIHSGYQKEGAESSIQRGYDEYNKGMKYAKKFNDRFQTYQLLWTHSSWIKTWDAIEALTLQEEAHKLAKEFGAPQKIAEAMADMGRISEALGEYDLAIECYESSLEKYGFPDMELYREIIDSPTFCIARIYCELGNGDVALELIDSIFDLVGPVAADIPYLHSQRAEALIHLKRTREATTHLEIGQKGALKSGAEGYVALNDLAAAYFELTQGNPLAAIQLLVPWYNLFLKTPAAIYNNRFLLGLTRAEIAANLAGVWIEASEEWMNKLENHAKEKQLPGIIMQHALLKAEYLMSQEQNEEAIKILQDALLDEHSDTTRTLYERIQKKLEELQI